MKKPAKKKKQQRKERVTLLSNAKADKNLEQYFLEVHRNQMALTLGKFFLDIVEKAATSQRAKRELTGDTIPECSAS